MSKEPHDPLRAKYDNLRHKLAFKESVINEQREIILGASERLVQLEAENARFRECLQEIATHSVCCDARHMADKTLKGGEA